MHERSVTVSLIWPWSIAIVLSYRVGLFRVEGVVMTLKLKEGDKGKNRGPHSTLFFGNVLCNGKSVAKRETGAKKRGYFNTVIENNNGEGDMAGIQCAWRTMGTVASRSGFRSQELAV